MGFTTLAARWGSGGDNPVTDSCAMETHRELASVIWSIADLLRGDYKQSEYGKVILPLTLLRRFDCALTGDRNVSATIRNTSAHTFATMACSSIVVDDDLREFINGFPPDVRDIIEKYEFDRQISRLQRARLLDPLVRTFARIDLSSQRIDNHHMGYVFEELIRRFSEISNETAGEHFTPREVVKLMVNLLIRPDHSPGQGGVMRVFDPACGTGGMLSAAADHIRERDPDVTVELFGQEMNAESYAICRSDMMLRERPDQVSAHIALGNSLSDDQHTDRTFDYILANPPFGVDWRKVKTEIQAEAARGYDGRFGAGLPRISDGSLLFLQHMIAKMRPVEQGGGRIALVLHSSALSTGGAGSGESNIRRWIIENDLLEGIVGLPDQLFYNSGIATYFWILTNRKPAALRGRVILVDARAEWTKMRKGLGQKRKIIANEQIDTITKRYADVIADPDRPSHPSMRVLPGSEFGYRRISVRPRGLRPRFETVPLSEDIEDYLAREVRPHVPDAAVDPSTIKLGYEIRFARYFHAAPPSRSLAEIDAELADLDAAIALLLGQLR